MKRLTSFSLVGSLVALGVAGCTDSSAPTTRPLPTPTLQTPPDGGPIPQNDPATGCAFSPTHGYGFQVAFTWNAVPGAARYHLVLHHQGSPFAALDAVVDQTSYLLLECNAYVIDQNLGDWRWTVAGITPDGTEGDWAEERTYQFEPIVLPPEP